MRERESKENREREKGEMEKARKGERRSGKGRWGGEMDKGQRRMRSGGEKVREGDRWNRRAVSGRLEILIIGMNPQYLATWRD
jgi:hypothetical protein